MARDALTLVRQRAAQHTLERDAVRWWTPAQLAARWAVSKTTVREIPRAELPYMELGGGEILHRRRYAPEDVARYEERAKLGPAREQGEVAS